MYPILQSVRKYEHWLKGELGDELVQKDLDKKHDKMKQGGFPFLRATYWRWAETIFEICPELEGAPAVLAIGDTHLENFGTWRDAEGRLIWGANDFDDAAVMPYALDLVRLACSALLGQAASATAAGSSAEAICGALLAGYAEGLENPRPIVLERGQRWLRERVILGEPERAEFWDGFDRLALAPAEPPKRFDRALRRDLPRGAVVAAISRRSAGTGSLGRPRFVAQAAWEGGPVLREAKALVMSAWLLAHPRRDRAIRTGVIAAGRGRAPDPYFRVAGRVLVRRLSPVSRKIEVESDPGVLLAPEMLRLMGREIANCHADRADRAARVRRDLKKRGTDWLATAATAAAAAVAAEQREFAAKE